MRKYRSVLAFAVLCLALILVLAGTATARSSGASADNPSGRSPGDVSFLTGPNEGAPLEIVQSYINSRQSEMGLSAADLADVIVTDQYSTAATGTTHIYMRQQFEGIEIFNANLSANVASDGALINLHSSFVGGLDGAVNTTVPILTAVEAVQVAATKQDLIITSDLQVEEDLGGPDQAAVLSDGGISQLDIPVRLVYRATDNDVRLAWSLSIYTLDGSHWWLVQVDALTGDILALIDWVDEDQWGDVAGTNEQSQAGQSAPLGVSALLQVPESYLVYAMPVESPNYAVPAPPADARTLEISPWLNSPTASPFGWHDTDGAPGAEFTNTQGNNVDSHKGSTRFDCGGSLECDPPLDLTQEPTIPTNVDAATVNLFYWNNVIHDLTYEFGFDESAGNFQQNNYGLGGVGNDRVNANAQAPGNCNANFGTPPDGGQPTMNMFNCNIATPSRDGDLDNGVIAHEYAHGISNRLTGGPSNVSCLNNSEQMGEGWSDWLGLIMTMEVGDAGTDSRGIGTWLLGEGPAGPGVRPTPYSTDMGINPTTYGDIGGLAVPHGVGYAWAGMVWEVIWNLVDIHGFNPNFYQDWSTGGNNLAMQLIMDGMKLQPCSPGFVDGRDAILLADQNLTGGQNQCAIWEGFAKRGLGFSADQGSPNSTGDGTEAFDIPVFCSLLGANPPVQDVCVGQDAIYNVTIGAAFSAPVNMSAVGNPAPTTATFSPNPVNTVPGSTDMTIGNTAGATPGAYTISIEGDDSVVTGTFDVDLNVFDAGPSAPTLAAPANGATNVSPTPTYSWNAAAGASSYLIEVATDPGFSNIVDSATVAGTSYVGGPLATNSLHYWRVTADNPCGDATSAVWSFTTQPAPGDCSVGSSPNVVFQEDFEAGAGGWTSSGPGNTWALSSANPNSGTSHFHANDVSSISDQYLISPPFALPSGQAPLTFQFWNYQEMEDGGAGCYDGGVLEISIDGGTTWIRLESELLTDPYDGLVDSGFGNPIAGSNAWCGDPQPYLNSIVDIDAWAGQTAQFRMRLATDSSVSHPGWDIDDVKIQSCIPAGGNIPPTINSANITSPIDENDTATLSGTFTDPDASDTFTMTIDWGDGSTPELFNYPAGSTTFTETHQYLDDDPTTGTPSDILDVNLTLEDSAGGADNEMVQVQVDNVDPVAGAGSDVSVPVSATVSFNGSASDVGSLDTHTFEWDFGDGGMSSGTLTPTHVYTATGTYTVTLTVTDDDTGVGTDEKVVTVVDEIKIYLPLVLNGDPPPPPATSSPVSALPFGLTFLLPAAVFGIWPFWRRRK